MISVSLKTNTTLASLILTGDYLFIFFFSNDMTIHMKDNDIGDEEATMISASLKNNSTLTKLVLSRTNFKGR